MQGVLGEHIKPVEFCSSQKIKGTQVRIKTGLFFILALACLAGLFWLMKPASEPAPDKARNAQPSLAKAAAEPTVVRLEDGQRVAGPAVIKARQGETLNIRFYSDSDAELHLHGYDIHLELRADAGVLLSFVAEHAGRFEYELHGHQHGHQALGAIEIQPR